MLEAIGAGACVVARGASAMGEVLGDAGATFVGGKAGEVAGVIMALLLDDNRRAALGRLARDRAQMFSVRRMTEGTLRSYERALGRTLLRAWGD